MTQRLLSLVLAVAGLVTAGPVYITTVNSPFAGFGYLGAVVGPASSSNDLGNNFNYDLLTGTNYTAPGAAPSAAGNAYSGADAETTIWTLDGSNDLSAQWINTDSSPVNAINWYLASSNGLGLTGNLADFASTFTGAVQVVFHYVSLGPDGYIQVIDSNTSTVYGVLDDQNVNSPNNRFGVTTNLDDALLVNVESAAPEPGSVWLIAAGMGLILGVRKRQFLSGAGGRKASIMDGDQRA